MLYIIERNFSLKLELGYKYKGANYAVFCLKMQKKHAFVT